MERRVEGRRRRNGKKGERRVKRREGKERKETGTSKLISIFTFPEAVNLFLYTQSRES